MTLDIQWRQFRRRLVRFLLCFGTWRTRRSSFCLGISLVFLVHFCLLQYVFFNGSVVMETAVAKLPSNRPQPAVQPFNLVEHTKVLSQVQGRWLIEGGGDIAAGPYFQSSGTAGSVRGLR